MMGRKNLARITRMSTDFVLWVGVVFINDVLEEIR